MENSTTLSVENKKVMDLVLEFYRSRRLEVSIIDFLVGIGVLLYLKKENIKVGYKESMFEDRVPVQELENVFYDRYNPFPGFGHFAIDNLMKFQNFGLRVLLDIIENHDIIGNEYHECFDYCINRFANYMQSVNVQKSYIELADFFVGGESKSIYMPFCGSMAMAIGMSNYKTIDACDLKGFQANRVNYCRTIDTCDLKGLQKIGLIRIVLADKQDVIKYSNGTLNLWTEKRYDAIVSMPPFRMNVEMNDYYAKSHRLSREYSEMVAATRFDFTTTEDGACISFMTPSALYEERSCKTFRKWATDNKFIDTIILLPEKTLQGTTIPIVCIVMRKHPHLNDAVRIIDASKYFIPTYTTNNIDMEELLNAYYNDIDGISANIPYCDIVENDYTWNIHSYIGKDEIDIPDGFELCPLKDLVSATYLRRPDRSNSSCRVLKLSDLSDDWTSPYVDIDSLPKSHENCNYGKLTYPAVLVSTIRTLKPTIVKASEEKPVMVNPNMLVLIPNENIDFEYLCKALSDLTMDTMGVIPRIQKNLLLLKKIPVSDIASQKALYSASRTQAMIAKAKEAGLEEVIENLKANYINEVRKRKHDMRPYLRDLNSIENMIRRKIDKSDDVELKSYVLEKLQQHNDYLQKLTNLLEELSSEEEFEEPVVVDIVKLLDDFVKLTDKTNDTFSISYHQDFQKLEEEGFVSFTHDDIKGRFTFLFYPQLTSISPTAFERVLKNIVENAQKHGFTEDRDDYRIEIFLTIADGNWQIDISNNGTPFPKGMNKLKYGTLGDSEGPTKGTGKGGNIVKQMVEHYGGNYDIISGDEWSTVRILLPIINDEEHDEQV